MRGNVCVSGKLVLECFYIYAAVTLVYENQEQQT